MAAGTLPEAPDMRPSVTSATRWPRSCKHAQRRHELVKLRHAIGLRPLESHHGHDIAIEFASLEGVLQFLLVMKDARRRFDDEAVGGNGRRLDDRAAERAFEHGQTAGRLEGMGGIAEHRFIAASLRRLLPGE